MKKKYLIYISLLFSFNSVIAQQFNTDNHMTMAYGTANNCVTYGSRSATFLPSVGLFKNFEFFLGATLTHKDEEQQIDDHFSTIINGKWMFYCTDDSSSGASVTFGTGVNPAYHSKTVKINSFQSYYAYADYTFFAI